MSQPTPYTPNADFSQQEANNASGRSTVNTAALDAEFAAIETTLDQTLANIQLLQRDDGQLKDTIVSVMALDQSVINLMGGWTLKGAWLTATDYAVNDIVSSGEYTYVCVTAHQSGIEFDSQYWSRFGFAGSADAAIAAAQASASAASAATSATTATTKATSATASATAAATSSGNAAAHASTATTKAGEAAASATNAANSAAKLPNLTAAGANKVVISNDLGLAWEYKTYQDLVDEVDISARGSEQIGYLPSGAGAFATDVQSKLRESVSVLDFHAGGSDHTAAFVSAGALAGQEVEIPYISGGYNVTGTIPAHCRFIGRGKPTINLIVNGSAGDRGFWLKSGSALSNVRIEREVIAAGISGEFNNAILIGEYYSPTGSEYTDISVVNVDLVGVDDAGGVGRTTIMAVMGNSHDLVLQDLSVVGYASYGLMLHWGGDFDPALPHTSTVTKSWHPRRINLSGFRMTLPAPDTALGCVFISACHDISIKNLTSSGISNPIVISAGDVGGSVAQDDSVGNVYKNIRFENTSVANFSETGVKIYGLATLNRTASDMWFACDSGSLVTFDGLVIERGALSTYAIDIRFLSNVTINALDVSHKSNLYATNYMPAVYIQSSKLVSVVGKTNVPFPYDIIGSTNVSIDSSDVCLRSDYNASCIGIRAQGLVRTDTLYAPVAVNDTTVTLESIGTDLIAGSSVTIGAATMTLTKSIMSGTSPAVLSITPSTVSALAGASVTLKKLISNIDIRGNSEKFHTGVYAINTSNGSVSNLSVSRDFYLSGLYDIHCRSAKAVKINSCTFINGGQLVSGTANIRTVDNCIDVSISECSFEDNKNQETKVVHNIYLFSNTSGSVIDGNKFFANTTSSIYALQPTTGGMLPVVSNNWFGPLVVGRVTPTTVVKIATIGNQQVGHASAAPTYGEWTSGDIVFNQAPVAAGKIGWVCVTGGSPGTWKPFGTIDS